MHKLWTLRRRSERSALRLNTFSGVHGPPPPTPHFLFAQENLIQLKARFHSGQVECLGPQNLENLNLIVKYIKDSVEGQKEEYR